MSKDKEPGFRDPSLETITKEDVETAMGPIDVQKDKPITQSVPFHPEAGGHSTDTQMTPFDMLQNALMRGLSPEILERFMDLNDRWEKSQAAAAYVKAMAAFKKNPPEVIKDMVNNQYGSRYSSLGNLVNTVNQSMGKHGFSANWSIDQNESGIEVTCKLSHSGGHSESVTMRAPPDTTGQKNSIQQIKSTVTYLRGVTFEAVTGIATENGSLDDDGNGASTAYISKEQVMELARHIHDTGSDKNKFLRFLKIEKLDMLPADKFAYAMNALEKAKAVKKEKGPENAN